MKYFATAIAFLILTSCSDNNIISLQLSPEKLILESKEINKADFEKELKTIIYNKIKDGIEMKELIIDLKTDKRTKRGDLADIEVSLRRLNVKRINYSTY